MITGLTNLGPSLRTPDLGAKGGKEASLDRLDPNESNDVKSFQKTLNTKTFNEDRVDKSDVSMPGMAQTQNTVSDRGKKSIENQDRELAMLEFMDSMQSEINIPPTRIVEAMATLPPEDQLKAPEETASQVISQLKLDPDDQDKAKALYLSFLTQIKPLDHQTPMVAAATAQPSYPQEPFLTSAAGQAGRTWQAGQTGQVEKGEWAGGQEEQDGQDEIEDPLLMTAVPPGKGPLGSTVAPTQKSMQKPAQNSEKLVPGMERRQLLNQSLDRMNQKFFLNDLKSAGGAKIRDSEMVLNAGAINSSEPNLAVAENSMAGMLNGEVEIPYNEQPELGQPELSQPDLYPKKSAQSSMNRQQVGLKSYQDSIEPDPMSALRVPGAVRPEVQSEAQPKFQLEVQSESYLKPQPELFSKNSLQNLPMSSTMNSPEAVNMQSSGFLQREKSEDDRSSDRSSEKGDSMTKPDQMFMTHTDRSESNHFRNSLANAATASPMVAVGAEKEVDKANLQQLIQSGKYLIKKGGGEASIRMSPEGMGQVHLNIAVQDGKVNVQMLAEQNETKKLLENSLGDLKNSLGAHKMELAAVRVDSSEPHRNGPQMDMQSDLSREQARQFLGQFRENNLERHQAPFYETPAMRSYSSANKIDPLRPASTETTTRRYAGTKKGSGLDLVA